jgi:ribosomal protein S18 acetylase RimI-like enzyme
MRRPDVGRTIRRAVAADAQTLSRLGTDTFVETFGHLYSAADLAAFLAEHHAPAAWAKQLADPAYAIWLLHEDAEPIGYVLAGACGLPHPEARPQDGEIKRLYLARERQGGGWGGRLLEAALEWLERDRPRAIWLSVWSENHGAQRFYARYGFEKAGEYEFVVGTQRDHEFIFRRRAAGA